MRRYVIPAILAAALPWAALAEGDAEAPVEVDADRMAAAEECFENAGGPEGCAIVFGWCPAASGQDARLACRQGIAAAWDAVLNAQWTRLEALAVSRNLRDRTDGTTPVLARLVAEQTAWTGLREASCGWSMPVPEGETATSEETRLVCLERMTRGRAQQLWDLSYYIVTAPLP